MLKSAPVQFHSLLEIHSIFWTHSILIGTTWLYQLHPNFNKIMQFKEIISIWSKMCWFLHTKVRIHSLTMSKLYILFVTWPSLMCFSNIFSFYEFICHTNFLSQAAFLMHNSLVLCSDSWKGLLGQWIRIRIFLIVLSYLI